MTPALNTTADGGSPDGGPVRPLGLIRWVLTAFMAFGLILFWLLDKISIAVWQIFAEPNDVVATLGSAVVAAATSYTLYRNERVNQVTHDVIGELTKVTWPSRRETQAATIVVIIASIIAAIVIGLLDGAWSYLTDLIY